MTISSVGSSTTILYGLGAIAEKMDEWNVVLTDGYNVPRQLTDMNSEITMSARYNPWGKPIETDGIGNFDASFIGTLIDATTGLIYVGNGQYYDPETGRFLTRGANTSGPNPYVPWNPAGGLIGALGWIGLVLRKRTKHTSKLWTMVTLVIPMALFLAGCSISFRCCGSNCGTPAPATTTTSQPDSAGTATQVSPAPTTQPDSTSAAATGTAQAGVEPVNTTDPCEDGHSVRRRQDQKQLTLPLMMVDIPKELRNP